MRRSKRKLSVGDALRRQGTARDALGVLEREMGGRRSLVDALLTADLDEKQQHFLALLADPARDRDHLALICADAGMNPSALLGLFRNAAMAKAYALALVRISESLPEVVADVAAKSVDREVPCPRCKGGEEPKEETCAKCGGAGRVFRESDLERQKMLFETAGLSKRGGGITITQQVGVATGGAQPLFSRLVRATDEAAYDAEIVGEGEEG